MEQFGKYRLVRRIGKGGMAEVYLARTTMAQGLEKELVIKKIHTVNERRHQFVSMFIDEAKVALGLNHPNIVQVFDFGSVGDTLFLAMELIEGLDVLRLIQAALRKSVVVPLGLAAYVVQQVCKGLDYAHRKTDEYGDPLGIVHRDVSPQNVLVSWDGAVKMVDFGIASARDIQDDDTIIKGKFSYMAPEQARGEPVDLRADVFSAGVVLFELTCLRPLFRGRGREARRQLLSAAIPAPRSINENIPEELEQIILRALAFHAEDRFQTARDFQTALGRFQLAQARTDGDLIDSASLAQFLASLIPERDRRKASLPPLSRGTGSVRDSDMRPRAGVRTPPLGIDSTASLGPLPPSEPSEPPESPGDGAPDDRQARKARQAGDDGDSSATPDTDQTADLADAARIARAAFHGESSPRADRRLGDLDTGSGGTPLSQESAGYPRPTEIRERKFVFVLEGYLRGLSQLEREIGHDRCARAVDEFFSIARNIAYKHDAHIHDEDPDAGLAAIIGLPVSSEDDPGRALRLALALIDALDAICQDLPGELRLAVGLQRGAAVLSRGSRALRYEVAEQTTSIAAMLARAAPGGEVLVSARVFRVTREDWRFEPITAMDIPADADSQIEPGDGDGAAKTRVYRLLGPKERAERLRDRRAAESEGSLLGRDLELKALRDAYRDVQVSRRKRPIVVLGDAGVGKRALVNAFVDSIPEGEAVLMRAASRVSTAYTPYAVLADFARDLLGLAEGADAGEVQRRIERLAPLIYPDKPNSREARGVMEVVGRLLGVRLGGEDGDVDATERRHRLLQLMARVEQKLAPDKPIVIIGEDAHWCDDESLDLFRELLSIPSNRPILGIVTARPDPRLVKNAADAHTDVIRLDELGHAERRLFIKRRFAPDEDVGELIDQIVARAGGNALFLREVLDSLIERGIVTEEPEDSPHAGLLRWSRRDAPIQVPTTVEAMLSTRLDELPPPLKETATVAAVLGRAPRVEAVTALLGRLAASDLDALVERGVFRRQDGRYAFRNDMTMTVAYSLLPSEERTRLHRAAAVQIESSPGYRAGQDDAVIARHWELAGDAERAADRYLAAAEHALEVGGSGDALRQLTRVLKLLPGADHARRFAAHARRVPLLARMARRDEHLREIDLLLAEADALGDPGKHAHAHAARTQYFIEIGDHAEAARAVEPALAYARASGDALAQTEATRLQASIATTAGDYERALALCDEALALCGEGADALAHRAQVLNTRGAALWRRGDLQSAIEAFAEMLVIYRARKQPRDEARALNNMGVVFAALGEHEEALGHYKSALKLAQKMADRSAMPVRLGNIGQCYLDLGDTARAERYLRKALELAGQLEDSRCKRDCALALGQVYFARREFSKAMDWLERGIDLAREQGESYDEIRGLVYLAWTFVEAGRSPQRALALARSATDLADKMPMLVGQTFGWAVQGLALSAAGKHEQAADASARAVALQAEQARPEGAEDVLYVHAVLCDRAGRTGDAREALRAAKREVEAKLARLRDPDLRAAYLASRTPQAIDADLERLGAN